MNRADMQSALEASLLDAVNIFGASGSGTRTDAMNRALDAAVRDFNRLLPRIVQDTLTLVQDQRDYPADPQATAFHTTPLVEDNIARSIDSPQRARVVPMPLLTRGSANAKTWTFRPTPDALTLAQIGTSYPFSYFAAHVLANADADTTLEDEDAPLLLLRAQAECMKEMAIRNIGKPVQLRDGQYSQTRNGTPAALYDLLMQMFEQQTRSDAGPPRMSNRA